MPNTIVVGDSVGLGISRAIPGSQFVGGEGRHLSQMGPDFNSAIAAAGQGDTIIISAGYNSAFSSQDVTLLTNSIQQMRQKGANVVIAGLRETGMDAAINAQYAATNRQLQQVATATGAVFSNQCTAIGNRNPEGNVHGGYAELAQACIAAAASTPAAPTASAAPATGGAAAPASGTPRESDRQADATPTSGSNSGGGILEAIMGFFRMIGEFFTNLWNSITGNSNGSQQGTGNGASAGNGGNARTLQQEISDVTAALGVSGQSGALQDNAISDDEKNTIKTELQQVRAALPGTMTDAARQEVTALLTTLREGGVQDGDAILGQSITELTTAIRASGATAPAEASAPAAPSSLPAASGPTVAAVR